jgi:hypothetical protein
MKETAIEWFLTEFQKQVWFEPNSELDIWIKELIPKAKEMEKQQIKFFFDKGHLYSGCQYGFEEIYLKTFNKEQ